MNDLQISAIERETRDQIKAHAMAHEYYMQFKKQYEHRKIIDYRIISGFTEEAKRNDHDGDIQLLKLVWENIEDGWQPLGSPFLDRNGWVCQAMVKYES
jgi:hypothetical protein